MNITTLITDKGLTIPEEITQAQWSDLHRSIMLAKKSAGKWLSESRKFGTEHYGLDFVAETEVQMELSLGIENKEKPSPANSGDKSKAIVTIEGITQSFKLWQRKVKDDIEHWDNDKIKRALELLSPIDEQIQKLKQKLG